MNETATTKPLTATVQETKRLTGLGHTMIYELIKDGRLKSVVVGRRRLIVYRSIEELIDPRAA